MNQKVLKTPRLLLIKSIEDEEELLIPFFADPIVNRYIGEGKLKTPEQVREALQKHHKHWLAFGHGFFTIFDKNTKKFMGRCGLVHFGMQHDNPEVEVGYLLFEKFWSKGFATEIARELLRWGFEELGFQSIMGVTRKENIASQNVLKKIGMCPKGEGIYPGTQVVCDYFIVDKASAILS